MKQYELPPLDYAYSALEPVISEEQLQVHHVNHHAKYVQNANEALAKLEEARIKNLDVDIKAVTRDLSFNYGGHMLHSLMWKNFRPVLEVGENEPTGTLLEKINQDFGSFADFKKLFSQVCINGEGSYWAVLGYDKRSDRLLIGQIEKHNNFVYPELQYLLVVDMWEHGYYLDYKNEKGKYAQGVWKIINWDEVQNRLDNLI